MREPKGTPTATMPDPASRQTFRYRFDRTSPRRSHTNTSTTAKTTAAGPHSQEIVMTSSFTRPATRLSVLDSYQDQDRRRSHKGLPRRHRGSRRGLCVRDAPMGASDGDSNRVGFCICLRGGRTRARTLLIGAALSSGSLVLCAFSPLVLAFSWRQPLRSSLSPGSLPRAREDDSHDSRSD